MKQALAPLPVVLAPDNCDPDTPGSRASKVDRHHASKATKPENLPKLDCMPLEYSIRPRYAGAPSHPGHVAAAQAGPRKRSIHRSPESQSLRQSADRLPVVRSGAYAPQCQLPAPAIYLLFPLHTTHAEPGKAC